MEKIKNVFKSNVIGVALLIVLHIFSIVQAASLNINTFKDTLNDVAKYDYGKSRIKLTELSNMIKDSYDSSQDLMKTEKCMNDFLKSDATFASKHYICEKLSIIGTKNSVSTLVGLLVNAETSDIARYALERIPGSAVDRGLREALPKATSKLKVGIINTLATRGDTESVAILEKLYNDSDNTVALAAVAGLGKIADSKATKALCKIREKTKGQLKLIALDSYLQCANKLLSEGEKEEAYEIYDELYNEDYPVNIRIAALKGMVSTCEKPYKIIRKAIKNSDFKIQTAGISLARDTQDEEITEELTSPLKKLAPVQQVQVLAALEHRKDPSAKPYVIEAVKSQDSSVRIAALRSLSSLGDASTVYVLAEAAASSTGDEQQVARESLYRLSGKDIDSTILKNIDSAEPAIKAELILSLGQRNVKSAVDKVLKTASSSDSRVRLTSIKALKELAGLEQKKDLVDLLTNAKSSTERTEAEKTVASVLGKEHDASAVLAVFPSVKDDVIKKSLLTVLGRVGDKSSLPVLRSALKEENPEIKKATIRALSDWPDSVPMDDLLSIAVNDTSKVNQILALRGYVNLVSLPSDRSVQENTELLSVAMELAQRPEERKLVLSTLSSFACQEALDLAKSYLQDKNLAAEAKHAVAKIEGECDCRR